MKKLFFLLIAVLLFSCSEDDKEHIKSLIFKETMLSDSDPVYKTETFRFLRGQLIQHCVNQKVLESEINEETNLTYSGNKVTVRADGATLSYLLNAEGYATQCVYRTVSQNREYQFSYSSEGYLTQMSERIENELYSTTTLTYNDGDLTSVTSSSNNMNNTINYQPSGKDRYEGCYIPCLGLLDTYPFTLHTEAVYAGLLGKFPRHFTARTNAKDNDDEYTDYTYQFDEKGMPTGIDSRTFYQGNCDDCYPNYPNYRSISITIE